MNIIDYNDFSQILPVQQLNLLDLYFKCTVTTITILDLMSEKENQFGIQITLDQAGKNNMQILKNSVFTC